MVDLAPKPKMAYIARMGTITFDTLKLARKLEAGGFTPEQATTAATALSEAMAEVPDLPTRADLKAELAETKAELLKWMFGGLAAQAALIVALLKLLP